jgi:cytochrome c oxidase subunit 1
MSKGDFGSSTDEALPVVARLDAAAEPGLVRAWVFAAVFSLGVAGALAFLVAMIKTPAVKPWFEPATFRLILVAHVTYAMTIWCMMAVAALWVFLVAEGGGGRFGKTWSLANLALTQIGGLGILAAMFVPGGGALLLDYVPLIDAPVYYAGYALFMAGALSEMVRFLAARRQGFVHPGPVTDGMTAAAVIVIIAALTFAWDLFDVSRDPRAVGRERLQPMVWGIGHVFQYVYVVAMSVAWWQLTGAALGVRVAARSYWRGTFALAVLLSTSTLAASMWLGAVDLRYSLSASVIILSLLALVALFAAVPIVRSFNMRRRLGVQAPGGSARTALIVSMILFTIGVLLDPAGNMGTLWVPAHYHGVIVGGVTIALMGSLYHLSERAGWPPVSRALATWQPVIFGIGVATMIAGLAWAGAEGAVRKDWVHGIVVSPQFRTGLNLMGFGAVIAVLGGIMFVVHTLYSLTRPRRLR